MNPEESTVQEMAIDHTVMYIGPNRFDKGLKFNTIYRGGVSSALMESWGCATCHIERLFVPIEDINEAMDAVKKTGTPLNLAYKAVLEEE